MRASMFVCVHVCMRMNVCGCVFMCVVCVCMATYVCVFVYFSMHVCVCS